MPVLPIDLVWRYSTPEIPVVGVEAQSSPVESLGGFLSPAEWTGGVIGDLFSDVTHTQNTDQIPQHQAVFLLNTNTTRTLRGARAYIASQTEGGADLSIGIDPTPASAAEATAPQAVSISVTTSPPPGVTFSAPTTRETGVLLGDLEPGQCRCLWLRLQPMNTPSLSGDSATVAVTGQTYA